jgi:hypothetical protein
MLVATYFQSVYKKIIKRYTIHPPPPNVIQTLKETTDGPETHEAIHEHFTAISHLGFYDPLFLFATPTVQMSKLVPNRKLTCRQAFLQIFAL